MLKSKTFLLTLIISTLLITNVEAKNSFEHEANKIQLNQISINSQNPQYSNKTEIYFLENTTDLLDTAYDAVTIDFDHNNGIHTRLLDGSSDNRNFVIQSLSYSEMNDKVIPLVINGFANEEF